MRTLEETVLDVIKSDRIDEGVVDWVKSLFNKKSGKSFSGKDAAKIFMDLEFNYRENIEEFSNNQNLYYTMLEDYLQGLAFKFVEKGWFISNRIIKDDSRVTRSNFRLMMTFDSIGYDKLWKNLDKFTNDFRKEYNYSNGIGLTWSLGHPDTNIILHINSKRIGK